MKKTFGLIFLLTLLLTGCGSSINQGYVTNKEYNPSYYYTTQSCVSYNSNGACTVYVPIFHHVDESWELDIQSGDKTGWVYVSEKAFDTYSIGDYYPRGEG